MKKVLIIEDDDSILEAVQLALEMEDYKTEIVKNIDDVYNTVKRFSPDIILLDLLLSGENGCNIIKNLRKDDETKDIPIVIMSAHPTAKESAEQAGANDFLAKPFDIDELLSIVKKNIK